jgi:hypothetical protein
MSTSIIHSREKPVATRPVFFCELHFGMPRASNFVSMRDDFSAKKVGVREEVRGALENVESTAIFFPRIKRVDSQRVCD